MQSRFSNLWNLKREYEKKPVVFNDENNHNPLVLEKCPDCVFGQITPQENIDKCHKQMRENPDIFCALPAKKTCRSCEGTAITGNLVPMYPNDSPVIVCEADSNGWLRCPGCGLQFTVRHKSVWTGLRHRACGQRLKVTIVIPAEG